MKNVKKSFWCWLFLLPMLILLVLFQLYPIAATFFYSLLEWSGMSETAYFVGLSNYKELLTDRFFWNAMLNSLKYTILYVPFQLVLSLLLAYILNRVIKRGSVLFRTMIFLPVITTTAVVGIVMLFIFGGTGVINQALSLVGIQGINWLGSTKTAMPVMVLIGIWKDVGIYMIYWMAALQNISDDVYEAAKIDGANERQTMFRIVLPLLKPVGSIIAVLCALSSLKVFDLIQSMTKGGPFYATDVAATFVYRNAFSGNTGLPSIGYGSAAALVFGVIVIAIGLIGKGAGSMGGRKGEGGYEK